MGHRLQALGRGDGQGARLAALDMRPGNDGRVEHHVHRATDHILDRRAAAPVRYMGELRAGLVAKQFQGHVLRGAIAGGSRGNALGPGFAAASTSCSIL